MSHHLYTAANKIIPRQTTSSVAKTLGYKVGMSPNCCKCYICCTFEAILSTLQEVVDGCDGSRAAETNGILLQIKSFKYILCLVIFDKLLSCSKGLSDVRQSTRLDLGKVAGLVYRL